MRTFKVQQRLSFFTHANEPYKYAKIQVWVDRKLRQWIRLVHSCSLEPFGYSFMPMINQRKSTWKMGRPQVTAMNRPADDQETQARENL